MVNTEYQKLNNNNYYYYYYYNGEYRLPASHEKHSVLKYC